MRTAEELARLLGRADLPPSFERWRVELAPGSGRATSGAEWAGAVVLVDQGSLEVECLAGGRRSFAQGDLLVLGLLPLKWLHNRGPMPLRLVAVRHRGHARRGAI